MIGLSVALITTALFDLHRRFGTHGRGDRDLVTAQVSTFLNGKRLITQGYYAPSTGTDLGWRHKIDDRVSLVLTARDILGTYRDKLVFDTPGLRSISRRPPDSRSFMIGFAWTLSGGKARDPGFDVSNGSSPSPP